MIFSRPGGGGEDLDNIRLTKSNISRSGHQNCLPHCSKSAVISHQTLPAVEAPKRADLGGEVVEDEVRAGLGHVRRRLREVVAEHHVLEPEVRRGPVWHVRDLHSRGNQ